ncbi:hypothetical protein TanjilG_01171 [Lupinus angustifolius]|uniref:bleomycin hydrolase n=1 Tax=Lupinus angustifolius TaxID=3871 RepID=A0A1J7GWM2_LUPAN|nr:hypothetical protein TanjilG_01171 [Lupinus angustifolius]
MAKKFVIFTSNLNYIIESNAMRNSPSSHILGLNKFFDWSPEEFKETYLNHQVMPTNGGIPTDNSIEENDIPYIEPPSSLNWWKKGAVSAVKNQGTCGCCWAFSAVGGIEGINAIATKKLITLSAQELVDCDTASDGCTNGRETNGWNWVIKNGGIASEAAYPYKAEKGICQASKIANSATISSFAKVAQSEDALWRATATQPISVNVDARDFQHYTKDTGILDGRNCKNTTDTNHAVLIVGYDRSKAGVDYWIVKNSWGQDWGKKGYIWIKRNTGLPYGIANSATISSFAKVAQSEDALWRATATQPISVNVDARDFQHYTKDTGILDGRNCKNTTDTNHAVLIVGYDRSKAGVDYWIVKNSWGQDWGKKGYIWIKRNTGLPYGVCAINAWAYYPIKK